MQKKCQLRINYQIHIRDDAFGTTEYRPDIAQAWAADLDAILRSLDERHWLIWTSRPAPLRAALQRMHLQGKAERFPEPAEVLIDAGDLSRTERALILYRHAKSGSLAESSVRAAHAMHERHFKIGLKKALVRATEEQIKEYHDRLPAFVQDWIERHSAIPLTLGPKIVRTRSDTRSLVRDTPLNVDDEGEFDEAATVERFKFLVQQAHESLSELHELFDLQPSLAKIVPLSESIQELPGVATRLFEFMASEGVLELSNVVAAS